MTNCAVIYYCNDYDFECEKFLSLLPTERLEKYHRIKLERDKKNCVGAYLLLLKGLKDFGIDGFELEYGENGKPYIKGNPVYFNLSHSKNGFACALDVRKIGVDFQEIVIPRDTTVKKVCSQSELKAVSNNSIAFTRLWTLKESVIKKNGETIADYGKYEFPIIGEDFCAYGNHFISFVYENSVISVCGEFPDYKIQKIKSTEL
ncbi:MAG: 4'-phosphopantetheinyl transferase superfamily protein [Clostridia bacterium]|nr:4'-phosphopantetheinyl transferase superfamily protein [Clostridia bacterium]